jgi:hypothetical protein
MEGRNLGVKYKDLVVLGCSMEKLPSKFHCNTAATFLLEGTCIDLNV